ncbi:hypothetical protein NQZ68_034206 [Dissostichus eleginoides]|nr:hypothetical protein NQZ68_034206 [Dissostichus eleginoides]
MGFIQRESLRRGGNLLRLKKCSCGRLERSGGRGGIPETSFFLCMDISITSSHYTVTPQNTKRDKRTASVWADL